jgi:hypothetical protein
VNTKTKNADQGTFKEMGIYGINLMNLVISSFCLVFGKLGRFVGNK